MATEHDILVAARDLISDPARWTQAAFARTGQGDIIGPEEDSAKCWCAIGALRRVAGGLAANKARMVLYPSVEVLYPQCSSIAGLNDTLGHAAILKIFDHAIAKAAPPATQEG